MPEEMTALEGILWERNGILAMLRVDMKSLRRRLMAVRDRGQTEYKRNNQVMAESYFSVADGLSDHIRDWGWLYKSIRNRWTPGGGDEAHSDID